MSGGDEQAWLERMHRYRLLGLAEMAAGMAHEVNQPLSGIRGFAEGLLIGLEEGWDIQGEEIKSKMRRIISEADRIDELIQGVRRFANDGERDEMVEVAVPAVMLAVRRLLSARIQAHGNVFTVTSPEVVPPVRANPFSLQEVLQILVLNAADACALRQQPLSGRIDMRLEVEPGDGPLRIQVIDNGPGMDATTLSRLGEPFFTTKGPDHGVGLGIATARALLSRCGGRLEFDSTPGNGTTASVLLYHRLDHSA